MTRTLGIFGAFLLVSMTGTAWGQTRYGGTSLFEPEIDIVNSGVIQDVQATVSHDRKYVTMNMRAQNAQLLALQQFTFQQGSNVQLPAGTAGGVNPIPANPMMNVPRALNAPVRLAPGQGGMLLMRRGITPILSQ